MPAADLILRGYPELLAAYLDAGGQVCVIVLDAAGAIEGCNAAFRRLLSAEDDPRGRPFRDFLGRGDWERLTASGPSAGADAMAGRFPFRRAVVALRPDRFGGRPLSLVVFEAGERSIVFGERVEASESEIVERMSVLTSEMADLNRELSKTNASLERANATITRLMNSDPLTGIANRRFLSEMLERAVSFAHRHRQPLALTICDIDRFKQINDCCGHAAGDDVLIAFAHLLESSCRAEDVAARFGGDEFCALLPATDIGRGRSFVERLRERWREIPFDELPGPVTASFGLAVLADGEGAEELLRRADTALYQAKRGGRDAVGCA
jgi:diguanylate cyclase (GGDEF)-like protein